MPALQTSAFNYVPPTIVDNSPANPTAPASTAAYKMQGLAALFTPSTPAANVLVIISATCTDTAITNGNGINLQLYYGPTQSGVAAPANAGNIPGSAIAIGPVMSCATGVTLTTAANAFWPIFVHGVAKGLNPGQQYWFDVAAESVITASNVALTNVHLTLCEIG